MTQRMQVYKCEKCGNMVEVLRAAGGTLTCCHQPMTALVENTVDASKEKHVPVVEQVAGGVKVKVGSVPHPMEEKHFIEWVEIASGDALCRVWLKPGVAPEATFQALAGAVSAREFCNLHGLWKA